MKADSHPRSGLSLRGWLGILALLIAVLAGFWAWRVLRGPRPALLLTMAPGAWENIDSNQQIGLLALMQDVLEQHPNLTVLTEAPLQPTPGFRMETLRLSGSRRGDSLVLKVERKNTWGRIQERRWEGEPRTVFQQWQQWLGLPDQSVVPIIPAEAITFWELTKLMGPFTFDELKPRLARALQLSERIPENAPTRYRAAYYANRLLIVDAAEEPSSVHACQRLYQQALGVLPTYPRAIYQFIRFKTDIGALRDAMTLALDHRKRNPAHPLAFGALAYAARNAGLLDGALKALEHRESLTGGLQADPGLGENTYLYRGDLERFERTLLPQGPTGTSPLRLFYRGYARLLRGDTQGALTGFREAQQRPGTVAQFERLSKVYELALTQKTDEARAELEALWRSRTSLRLPDGEFTFKLAEAFAFLGDKESAIDVGARAFAHGFGCARWYEASPLLKPVQDHPRWRALVRFVKQRQDALAESFPLSRF